MITRRLFVAILIPALSFITAACGDDSGPTQPTPRAEYSVTDLRVGTGAEATAGKRLSVNYTGWLYDPSGTDGKGGRFDGGTHTFTLGAREVISGWDRGVAGMRVGGQRRLVLPPELAYGTSGNGPIPPNATLVFDVELLAAQ
jgi:FKBP-type peptidyl-prolyl cis-trans isomerase FkpA